MTLPPLRARAGDIVVLAEHFGRRMASELDWLTWVGFSERAEAKLVAHDWPGNVRELRNVVERAVYRWDNPQEPVDGIEFDHLAAERRQGIAVGRIARPGQRHGVAGVEGGEEEGGECAGRAGGDDD